MWREGYGSFSCEKFGGEDIPNIFGEDIDGEVVDLFRGIGGLTEGVELAKVTASQPHLGGLDLHTQKAAILLDHHVVARRLTPGLGYVEAHAGSDGHE